MRDFHKAKWHFCVVLELEVVRYPKQLQNKFKVANGDIDKIPLFQLEIITILRKKRIE